MVAQITQVKDEKSCKPYLPIYVYTINDSVYTCTYSHSIIVQKRTKEAMHLRKMGEAHRMVWREEREGTHVGGSKKYF